MNISVEYKVHDGFWQRFSGAVPWLTIKYKVQGEKTRKLSGSIDSFLCNIGLGLEDCHEYVLSFHHQADRLAHLDKVIREEFDDCFDVYVSKIVLVEVRERAKRHKRKDGYSELYAKFVGVGAGEFSVEVPGE